MVAHQNHTGMYEKKNNENRNSFGAKFYEEWLKELDSKK